MEARVKWELWFHNASMTAFGGRRRPAPGRSVAPGGIVRRNPVACTQRWVQTGTRVCSNTCRPGSYLHWNREAAIWVVRPSVLLNLSHPSAGGDSPVFYAIPAFLLSPRACVAPPVRDPCAAHRRARAAARFPFLVCIMNSRNRKFRNESGLRAAPKCNLPASSDRWRAPSPPPYRRSRHVSRPRITLRQRS
jgi:hypothetical protein